MNNLIHLNSSLRISKWSAQVKNQCNLSIPILKTSLMTFSQVRRYNFHPNNKKIFSIISICKATTIHIQLNHYLNKSYKQRNSKLINLLTKIQTILFDNLYRVLYLDFFNRVYHLMKGWDFFHTKLLYCNSHLLLQKQQKECLLCWR